MLKLTDANGKPIGMLNWYAVHGTSMNSSNRLISGDNKGYAAQVVEKKFNPGLIWLPPSMQKLNAKKKSYLPPFILLSLFLFLSFKKKQTP